MKLKKRLFWLVSRVAFWCYRRAPVFGALRASVGVTQSGDRFLAIRRNDGRGFSFPGGLAFPWETEEQTLLREVREETGLSPEGWEFVFRYKSSFEIPCRIAVFKFQAAGELRNSWEGTPEWVDISALRKEITASQSYIVESLCVPLLAQRS